MTRMNYVFGIDGGGSGCRVAVCDLDGQVVAEATGAPANFTTDPDGAIQSVLATIQKAKSQLSSGKMDLAGCAAHVGLAGIMQQADADTVAAAMPFAQIGVTDDRVTTVAGALGSSDGIVASVGTGSFVAAQTNGSRRFLGGWGHMLGDQASGAWLGVQALRRAVLAYEGLATSSELTRVLMRDHGSTPLALLAFVQTASPSDFAALAPKVIQEAQSGDAHGVDLMQKGARYLMSCLKELEIVDHDTLCLTGGIGPHYATYLDPKIASRIQPSKGGALEGAVQLALQMRCKQ